MSTSTNPHPLCSQLQHITPQSHSYDTCPLPFFPMHSFLYVSHLYVFSSSLQLTWLADPAPVTSVYPNWMQYTPCVLQEASLLDGVDAGVRGNSRRFSKTSSYPPCCRYAFNFFYPYLLMMSSSPLSLLIHSFSRPTTPLLYLINHSHTPYCLCLCYLPCHWGRPLVGFP